MSHVEHLPTPEGVASAQAKGYTHVVAGSGRLVAVSGLVALDESGELVGRDDPTAQAEQIFENVSRCLAAAGATFDDVIKLTYFLTDMRSLPQVMQVRNRFIPGEAKPASTAVQVVRLASPDLLLEIEALAIVAD
jgi:enamine deaminase RidA (YjgF/YER057c/UK114 family)